MEEGEIRLIRCGHFVFPAAFHWQPPTPAPCGYLGDENHPCTCTRTQIDKYRAHLSGPLCERIDMCVEIRRVSYDSLIAPLTGSSAEMREQVLRARELQRALSRDHHQQRNARMQARELQEFCIPDAEGQRFLQLAYERYHPESAPLS